MNNASHGFRFEPQDLRDPRSAIEALAHWDELDPNTLAHLAKHPVHGPRLAMLQAADGWLADQAAAARQARDARAATTDAALTRCPSADELYDFGRGPGYTPLSHSARATVDRHLAQCRHCELLVETLVAPPPAPLELEYDSAAQGNLIDVETEPGVDIRDPAHASPVHASLVDEATEVVRVAAAASAQPAASFRHLADEHRPIAPGLSGPTGLSGLGEERSNGALRFRRWAPVAAAATLLATAAVWTAMHVSGPKPLSFPDSPLLRGATSGNLLFPREHVLRATPELLQIWPSLGERLTFEIQPDAQARSYRIEVSKHDGSAFGASESVWKQPSEAATFSAENELGPGHYTWEAWTILNGLDHHLGRRDFDVSDDAQIRAELLALKDKPEPERSLEAVRLLHENGYRTDARRIARSMKPTPERDAYLGQIPGR